MSDDLEPLSTESYTLADFSREDWMDRPEYRAYQGVQISHLKRLHAGAEYHESPGHVAFVSLNGNGLFFEIWLYGIVTWDGANNASSAQPSFRVLGRTFEGVTEVQACPADSPLPDGIIAQMQWVEAFVEERGWHD